MDLQQAFGNIQYACNECLLSQNARVSTNEALKVVADALNSFEALKKQTKEQTDTTKEEENED